MLTCEARRAKRAEMRDLQGSKPLQIALRPAADTEQQIDDEVECGGREGDDVEVLGVQVPLHGRYGVEQESDGGLEQRPEAIDGVSQNVGALSDVHIRQRYVGEYQQDDQGEYRADETHAPISFPSRPTLSRPGWLRGVRAASIAAPDSLLPVSLLRAVLSGQYSNITLLLGRGAEGGLRGGSPRIPGPVLFGGLLGVEAYVAIGSSGRVGLTKHLRLARPPVLEEDNASSDQKADYPDRERHDVAHQDAARRSHPRHPPDGEEPA